MRCTPATHIQPPPNLMQRLEQPDLFLSKQLRRATTPHQHQNNHERKEDAGVPDQPRCETRRNLHRFLKPLYLEHVIPFHPSKISPQPTNLKQKLNVPEKTTSHHTFLAIHSSCRSCSHESTSTSGLTAARFLRSRGNNARSTTCRRCSFNSSITDFKNQKRLTPSSAHSSPRRGEKGDPLGPFIGPSSCSLGDEAQSTETEYVVCARGEEGEDGVEEC